MPPDITCPVCKHRFAGPEGTAAGFACPRCGATATRTEVRPAQYDIQARPSAPAALPTAVCPSCGKAVPGLCVLCPHCEEPLQDRYRTRRADVEGDADSNRRKRRNLILLTALAGVGALSSVAVLTRIIAKSKGPIEAGIAQVLFVAILLTTWCVAGVYVPLRFRSLHREGASAWFTVLIEVFGGISCVFLVVLALAAFLMAICTGLS
jgi:hypothetical protein